MFLTYLECTACGKEHDWQQLQNLCTACSKPLFAIYDLDAIKKLECKMHSSSETPEKSLWRWRQLLPLPKNVEPISLGEGATPLLRSNRFGPDIDIDLWIKDESVNPTQSFKARGM